MNRLHEIGGLADVYIINKIDKNINGINYVAGEPYTILSDVIVNFEYNQINSQSVSSKTVLSNNISFPSKIKISNLDLTDKICGLVMKKENDNKILVYEKEIVICEEDGMLYLKYEPISNIFVKDDNFNNLDFSVNSFVLQGEFEQNKRYLVFYKHEIEKTKYEMISNPLPYFSIEIHFKGNTDKRTEIGYMFIETASLTASPVILFNKDNIIGSSLDFDIIYDRNKNIWSV